MPSRAYISFLLITNVCSEAYTPFGVNALSGLYLISTTEIGSCRICCGFCVNALSGLYLISTRVYAYWTEFTIMVSMPSRAYISFLHPYELTKHRHGARVSMPSRAYISFLRYPFKNLGFMRFPEPVFAGIYQNILTTAVFRAC